MRSQYSEAVLNNTLRDMVQLGDGESAFRRQSTGFSLGTTTNGNKNKIIKQLNSTILVFFKKNKLDITNAASPSQLDPGVERKLKSSCRAMAVGHCFKAETNTVWGFSSKV